jgi:esterase FrsA
MIVAIAHRLARPALMAACLLALAAATPARAQTSFPGDLAALKAEVQKRAGLNQYPLIGYDPQDIAAGLARLHSKSPDDWAAVWSAFGDKRLDKARAEEPADKAAAARDYAAAHHWYVLARFPAPTSPGKAEVLKKEYAAFFAFDRLTANPVQVIKVDTPQGPITAYLRLPKSGQPLPLLVRVGGLDGYKENDAIGDSVAYARNGVAVLSMDAPGTSQSVRASADATKALLMVVDQVRARPEIDRARVVLYGGSWGGYWSTAMAYQGADRFTAVVSQAPPTDKTFTTGLDQLVTTPEYLFDMQQALELGFGVKGLADLRRAMAPLSLRTMGLLDRPTPPMLMLNGARDTLFPPDEMFTLLHSGTPKYVWVNPTGIHVGRDIGGYWDNPHLQSEVIRPFILRYLGVTGWNAAPRAGE